MHRVWGVKLFGEDRQYGGNIGYSDDPEKFYRYDSNVANHKQISEDDLVLLRNRRGLFGVARVMEILSGPGQKEQRRCSECESTSIKKRKTIEPLYRCQKCGHEFDRPKVSKTSVVKYEARFGDTFMPVPPGIDPASLMDATMRPSDQMSIEEMSLEKIGGSILNLNPGAYGLLASFAASCRPDALDSEEDTSEVSENGAWSPGANDTRSKAIRSIMVRRGQQKFRKSIIRRYGAACQISGCKLIEIVEAAHVWPYRGDGDNHPTNGLLLRSDLHTMFDLDLLGIEPGTLRIHLHPEASGQGYSAYHGRVLECRGNNRPSPEALGLRWPAFEERLGEQ